MRGCEAVFCEIRRQCLRLCERFAITPLVWWVFTNVLVIILVLPLIGCEPSIALRNNSADTPLSPMSDESQSDDSIPALRADLMRWVTYSRQRFEDRQAALEKMLEQDPDRFWRDAAIYTWQIDDWPMIRLMCVKAANTQDKRALAWLVRSWSMPSRTVLDDQRPERDAIQVILEQDARAYLHEVFVDREEQADPETRVAAWTILVRTEASESLFRLLASMPDDHPDPLVASLQRSADVLQVLPPDRHAIARLMCLTREYDDLQWSNLRRWKARIAGDGPATLSLRHLPALRWVDPEREDWTRQHWLEQVESRLAGRRHVSRGDGAEQGSVVSTRPDRLADYALRLGLADLVVIDAMLDAMEDTAFQRLAFEQADADRLDRTSEYGGALTWNEKAQPELRIFPPMIRRHDEVYIASSSCMQAVYIGLAHVHFHAQRFNHHAWAGPGKGDLDFADTHHANAMVLTFVDEATLNLDAYFPGGISVDLGCITRP